MISSYLPFSGFVMNIHKFFKVQNQIKELKQTLEKYKDPTDLKILQIYQATQKSLKQAYREKFIYQERVLQGMLTTIGVMPTTAFLFYVFRNIG